MYTIHKLADYIPEKSGPDRRMGNSDGTYATDEESGRDTRTGYQMMSPQISTDLEQSQKLRSLHQSVLPVEVDHTDTTTILGQVPPPLLPPPKPQHRTRPLPEETHYDKLGVTGRNDPNTATSLLRRGQHLYTTKRGDKKYGTTSSFTPSRRSYSFRRNLFRQQPSLFQRFKKEKSKSVSPVEIAPMDRRNEFFTMKRLILMTLGMPNTPAISPYQQKLSTCLAVPFYILLYIWGIGIFVIALQSDGWLWSGICPDIVPAKILTMLAGGFFVFLGLYWLLMLWWSRPSRTTLPPYLRNFSSLAFLWWVLCMYFVGVASALATQVLEYSDLIVTLGSKKVGNLSAYGSHGGAVVDCGYGEVLEVPNNMAPLWALCSMGLLWFVYVLVFIVATVTIYTM